MLFTRRPQNSQQQKEIKPPPTDEIYIDKCKTIKIKLKKNLKEKCK